MTTVTIKQPIYKPKRPRSTTAKLRLRFTPDVIADLLKTAIGSSGNPKKLKMPDEPDLLQLFVTLELLRVKLKISHLSKLDHIRRKAAVEAIEVVKRMLVREHGELNRAVSILDPSVLSGVDYLNGAGGQIINRAKCSAEKTAKLAFIGGILKDLTILQNDSRYGFAPGKNEHFTEHWHHILPQLVWSYQNAMLPANRPNPCLIHAKGPGAKFIESVIPYLTGEEASAPAIAKVWRDRTVEPSPQLSR
jgi:hypothetical protein